MANMRGRDQDGQAAQPAIHFGRICAQKPDELAGLLMGVVADGEINASEARFVIEWFKANWDYIGQWPFNVLYERFSAAIADGTITSDEERELLRVVAEHVGGGYRGAGIKPSSQLLCDDPVPNIIFDDRQFVITGVFLCGKRRAIENVVFELGGAVKSSITAKTDYLLIGDAGSRDWLMTNYGTKIQAAADRKQAGQIIGVVNEQNFLRQIEPHAARLGALLSGLSK